MKINFRRALAAFMVSCGVYVLPVIGPHMIFFSGGMLAVSARTCAEGTRPVSWFLMELALLVALQVAVGTVCYSVSGKRIWILLPLLGTVYFGALMAVFYGMAYAIPVFHLVGKETEPENATWPVLREFEGVDLFSPDPATRNHFQQAGKLLLRSTAENHYRIASVPESGVAEILVPVRCDHFATALAGVTPSGAYLMSVMDPPTGKYTWFYSRMAGDKPFAIDPGQDPGVVHTVKLFPSGEGVIWIEKKYGEDAVLRLKEDAKVTGDRRIGIGDSAWKNLVFYDRDGEGNLWLFDGGRELVCYEASGKRLKALSDIGGVRIDATFYMQHEKGRLTWEIYRDSGPCRVAWELPGRVAKVIELVAGKAATSASLSPDGRWVAVSTTTSLNIGSQRDTVLVYETGSGAEVFRLYQPRYTRSEVCFPGKGFFAYSTIEGGKSKVIVRKIEEPVKK